ncbi:MAG: UbiD family decarboxylase [Elusimicrobiota bacterium]
MSRFDISTVVKALAKSGALKTVAKKTSAKLHAAKLIAQTEPDPILLKNVQGAKVLANILPDRESLARILGVNPKKFLTELGAVLDGSKKRPGAGIKRRSRPFGDFAIPLNDHRKLPVLTYYPQDGGPYITAGVWLYRDPIHGMNLSYHRMMMSSPAKGTVRVVERRGLDTALKNSGGELEAAILIGAPAHVLFAASLAPEPDVYEMDLAARIGKVELAPCRGLDLEVPADCQAVIEGRFTTETGPEGPFVDITETQDPIRTQPVFEITGVWCRKDPIHYTIIPGLSDHKTLMGIPKELDIYREVSKVCRCLDVRMTPGGSSWLHALVVIDKKAPNDGRRALEAAFRGHKSLKHCVVVDSDIDIGDPLAVEWALATRFQADKDMLVQSDVRSSSLDPSARHEPGKGALGAKLGLDATIPTGGNPKLFKRYAG